MPAPYKGLETMNVTYGNTTNLNRMLTYVNDVTNGNFAPAVLLAFFFIAMLGTYYARIRFTGRARLESCIASSGFVTTGLAIIMSTVVGFLSMQWVVYCLVVTIFAVAYMLLSPDTNY